MQTMCHMPPVNLTSLLFNWQLRGGSQRYVKLTSWSYSKKIWKFLSLLKTGWEDNLCRNTSCTWTVFLNTARYSLQRKDHYKSFHADFSNNKNTKLQLTQSSVFILVLCWTHASSSCFILVYSSLVIVASPSPSLCIFSLGLSKSGLGGAGGICEKKNRWVNIVLFSQYKNKSAGYQEIDSLYWQSPVNSLLVLHSPPFQLECHATK